MIVGSILVREEGIVQRPIYYTSRLLRDLETRYSKVEKVVLSLITSAQKLRPYFQSHTVVILIDQSLRQILQMHDMSDRLIRWIVELSKFDIQYKPKMMIKSQALADFIAECTIPNEVPIS